MKIIKIQKKKQEANNKNCKWQQQLQTIDMIMIQKL